MNKFLIAVILLTALSLGGCAEIPMKDGELFLNKNSTAVMENAGIAKIKNQF
jgi:hypothetical protein